MKPWREAYFKLARELREMNDRDLATLDLRAWGIKVEKTGAPGHMRSALESSAILKCSDARARLKLPPIITPG